MFNAALRVETTLDTAMPGNLPPAPPYERVMALAAGNDELLRSYDESLFATGALRRIVASAEFCARVSGYWAEHFAAPSATSIGRNCIDFALRMRGIALPTPHWNIDKSWIPTFRTVEELYDEGKELDALELRRLRMYAGGLAIIGSEDARSTGTAGDALLNTNVLHALVSTGEDSPRPWLGVVATKGSLGFTSLEDALSYYGAFRFDDCDEPAWQDIHVRVIE